MPDTSYARRTNVTSSRSLTEMRRLLLRYKADQFVFSEDQALVQLGFTMAGRQVRFAIPLPTMETFEYTPTGRFRRTEKAMREEWELACRQRWRAAVLLLKAKLEAIALGVVSFESAFLPDIVLGPGDTVYERLMGDKGILVLPERVT